MSPCAPETREEARRLTAVLDPPALLQFLSNQLGVLKHQAQMLLGLCGLAVTVTGFSGTHMIEAGRLSAGSMVAGIALIFLAAVVGLWALLSVKWVSQELCEDLEETARRVLTHRDLLGRRLSVAGGLVGLGLGAYLLSVALAAWMNVGR
ncbi:MAG: hypothetical protein JXX28_19400 [Deltaproteobacteria bacterium]|nr:hypothetical protein [Deltaproteobacteria bacterium]